LKEQRKGNPTSSETADVRAANAERTAQLRAAMVAARDRSFTRPGAGK